MSRMHCVKIYLTFGHWGVLAALDISNISPLKVNTRQMDISVIPCRVAHILSTFDVDDSHQKNLDFYDFQRYYSTVKCSLHWAVNIRFVGYMAWNLSHNFLEFDVRLSPKAVIFQVY